MTLAVPGKLDYRSLVTRTVAATCHVAGARHSRAALDDYVNELISAVGEAFNNIAIHGYGSGSSGPIELVVAPCAGAIRIELRDFGKPFDPSAAQVPDILEPRESGMGLFVIRSFVDRVEYTAGEPNELSLHKCFP